MKLTVWAVPGISTLMLALPWLDRALVSMGVPSLVWKVTVPAGT